MRIEQGGEPPGMADVGVEEVHGGLSDGMEVGTVIKYKVQVGCQGSVV